MKKFGLTIQQYNVLRILKGHAPEPITINGIIERMLDKMCDASRMVDRLKQKELIERCVSKKDRRSVDIVISQKGLDLLSKIDKELDENKPMNNLSDEESKTLNKLLDKLRG